MNICINGIESMKSTGGLLLVSSHQPSPGHVAVSISDTGCGIPRKHLSRIFDFFFTTKGSTNTGLGLSMVNRITKEFGGRIEVATEEMKGTKFTVHIPTAAASGGNETL